MSTRARLTAEFLLVVAAVMLLVIIVAGMVNHGAGPTTHTPTVQLPALGDVHMGPPPGAPVVPVPAH